MINIEKFTKIRKKKHVSQIELVKGICTQATLSNFESAKKIPSFKILRQLCKRLGIEVGDIIINSQETEVYQTLTRAEYASLRLDFSQIFDCLAKLNNLQIAHLNDHIHFNYLKGLYALENDRNEASALFYFQSILKEKEIDKDNIYYLLALNGCAQVCEARRDHDETKKYYDAIAKTITKIQINDDLTALHTLLILTDAGDFYGRRKNYKESNYLLRYAYQVGSQFHKVYYMERILYRLGQNSIAKGSKKTAIQHLQDARSFACFNHDQYVLTKAKQLIDQLTEN